MLIRIFTINLLWLILAAAVYFPSSACAQEKETVSILVVSQGGYRPFYINDLYRLRPILTTDLSANVMIYQESPDFNRFDEDKGNNYREAWMGWLKSKYQGYKFNVIVASGQKAIDFVLKARPAMWPQTPVMAIGRTDFVTNSLANQTNATGFIVDIGVKSTLSAATRLFPDTRRIAFISPGDTMGNGSEESYQHDVEQAENFCEKKFQLIKLIGLTVAETKQRLARLPSDTIVFYDDVRVDLSEPPLSPRTLTEDFNSVSKAPIFSYSDFFVGYGAVGGVSINRRMLDSEIASQIAAVIRAGTANSVPVQQDKSSRFVFDWRQMQKFGLSTRVLPANSDGRFLPPTLWQSYHTIVIIVGAALAMQTGLIIILLFQRRRMRRAEEELFSSQQMLRTVLDTIPQHVFWKDHNSVFIGCNRAVMEECGNVVGKTDFETSAVKFAQKYRADDLEVMQKNQPKLNFEEPQARKDGSPGWYRTSKVPLHDKDGKVIGILGTYDDITDHKRTEEALRENERRLRTFTEASFEGICVSENGRLLDVNDQFTKMFGYERNELIGREIITLVAPAWRQTVAERIRLGEGKPLEHQCLRKDGSAFECEAQARTVLLSDRNVRVSAVRDLTERKQLEAQLRQSQKMQAFGQLAAGVAHDFNNILTVIQGNVSLLQMDTLKPAEQTSASSEVFRAVERATNLTRQLLTFSRRQPMQPQDLDLNDVVANITKMLQRLISEDIALETRFAPGGSPVHADPGMMEQVLMNLAINSRDAMPKGGLLIVETAHIVLENTTQFTKHTANPGEFIRLSITDSGCGIAPENLPQIFEPFFTTKDVGKGTGLGLATVFGIIEQHHGWIEVESQLNKGATFHIYLPRLEKKISGKGPISFPFKAPGGTETILLVEDEAPVRQLMQCLLERHGYHIHAAVSGIQALEIWHEYHDAIDILVTDMVMPDGLNGHELADKLQTEKPNLKIIYCSGYANNLPGKNSPPQNNESFLEKPFEPIKLLQRIRDCADAKN